MAAEDRLLEPAAHRASATAVTVPALWICGVSGVGKSTVGWELYCQVRDDGVRSAYVDLDQVSFCLPAPDPADPHNHRLRARNLAAVWSTYRDAGARCLVFSGLVDRWDEIRMVAAAVPDTALTICRLRASPSALTERIFRRARGGGPPLPGERNKLRSGERLRRAAQEEVGNAARLDRDGIGDVTVDTDGIPPAEVARRVRAAAGGWPGWTGSRAAD